ncbi:CBS domain-containing protein CBSX1, chloroplastic-like isoform X2 [Salvia splendens]|uniref:CBS domain-containing protein CBSX1, chloroplastic-like isoform X2 n=1 Tax=Salvia splendens TaxID=180675 RepID=UPI001C279D6E|nr:CBS domain-containing protein CBSX1, chloroplastic-like isoform X2 [Salvia splendens]
MSSISRLKVFPLFLLPPTSSVPPFPSRFLLRPSPKPHIPPVFAVASTFNSNSVPPRNGVYRVGDFMTRKEDLHVVKSTTTVEQALQMLVENRITGFPVIDDDWKLVGLVSDYDLLALDSVSGTERSQRTDVGMFPEVDSTWKTFKEVQNLLTKTNGQVVGDLMTPAPVVVGFSTSLEDAARVLLKTKYRRLPVVDNDGRLLGIITRGNVVRAALQLKRATEKATTTA